MRQTINSIKRIIKYTFGDPSAHKARYMQIKRSKSFLDSSEFFKEQIDNSILEDNTESPIIVLSAGWRSGSTLLQRLISSSDNMLLWGEPYDRCNIVQALAKTLVPFSSDWPPKEYLINEIDLNTISEKWIANLYPSKEIMLSSHRNFLTTLFADSARKLGAHRWGIKEVRLGLNEAIYIKMIFPNAKFLFLIRDLTEAYLSYKAFRPNMNWYSQWPHGTAFTALGFAKHRARLVREFEIAEKVTGGLIVDYADLINNPSVLNKIDDYCNVVCDRSVLSKKVGSARNKKKSQNENISWIEKMLLKLGNYLGSLK